jgi:hypothetical protein
MLDRGGDRGESGTAPGHVFRGAPDADVVETLVIVGHGSVTHDHELHDVVGPSLGIRLDIDDRVIGHHRRGVAVVAAPAQIRIGIHKDAEAIALRRSQGVGVALDAFGRGPLEPVKRRVIRDQSSLIGLHCQTEEQGEVPLDLPVLVGGQDGSGGRRSLPRLASTRTENDRPGIVGGRLHLRHSCGV